MMLSTHASCSKALAPMCKRLVSATCCVGVVWILLQYGRERSHPRGRSLLAQDSEDCIPSGMDAFPGDFLTQDQRRRGGVVAHFSILFYSCAMTALVCDEHFVPALEAIVQKLQLSPDVAGATFMAMGASAPELFSSIAGVFITEGDIGLGTILGSAVFNMLAISGVSGILLWKTALHIDWYPVVRDCLVYACTVSLLSLILADNSVQWWEALTLLLLFGLYILLMRFNSKVEARTFSVVKYLNCCSLEDPEKGPLLDVPQDEPSQNKRDSCGSSFWRILMWVPSWLFRLTIPPIRFYPLTFVASITWMGILSYVAVWMVTIIGYTFHIPDSVSGLTLLAVGSSVPDLVATVLIAKTGRGNMAISNLLGSNIFDLAFCLGAPWFVKSLLTKQKKLVVYSSAMVYTTATLLITLLALLLTFQLSGWRLSRATGIALLSLYLTSITLSCLYEMNVFAVLNKPTCF